MMQGYGNNFRAPRVDIHSFSMVPRADVPRSTFNMQSQHKTTFSASKLIPFYVQEVLPGDSFNVNVSAFCRLATPLYPIMDNMELETFFFFVPNRLVWNHWVNFNGEQNNPADTISYAIPQIVSPVGGFAQDSIYDYMGLPTTGQVGGGNTIAVSALPFRAYNFIVQEWFRDQNQDTAMQTGTAGALTAGQKWMWQSDDGPDPQANYSIFNVRKRHDYFTAALPWTQKGGVAVTLPLGTSATVKPSATEFNTAGTGGIGAIWRHSTSSNLPAVNNAMTFSATGQSQEANTTVGTPAAGGPMYPTNLYADLSTATAATINSIRLAFQTQRLLERDARGGTRYSEMVRNHFGVVLPDPGNRPQYLGGGKSPVNIAPVPQTTATGLTGGTSPLGTLSAAGLVQARHGFQFSSVEHGHILGLVTVRNDKIYQQGIRRMWSRLTRYDFYLPVFQALGEQAILNKEIYADGSGNDTNVFGYIPRWDEYRFMPSITSSYFRSTHATPLDSWHLAQKFTSLPALNSTFLADDLGTTYQRCAAAGAATANQQILADFFIQERVARPLPMFSVPGMVDHF